MSRKENIEKDFINRILRNDESAIDDLYLHYRDSFVIFLMNKYKAQKDDALDIFQDVVVAVYRNVKMKKLTELNSSIKTYLYAIGKNLWLKQNRKKTYITEIKEEAFDIDLSSIEVKFIQQEEKDRTNMNLKRAISSLGDPCTELLTYFYYYNYSYDEIIQRMEYNNVNVAKTQKSRCMKYLRDYFNQ